MKKKLIFIICIVVLILISQAYKSQADVKNKLSDSTIESRLSKIEMRLDNLYGESIKSTSNNEILNLKSDVSSLKTEILNNNNLTNYRIDYEIKKLGTYGMLINALLVIGTLILAIIGLGIISKYIKALIEKKLEDRISQQLLNDISRDVEEKVYKEIIKQNMVTYSSINKRLEKLECYQPIMDVLKEMKTND